MSMQGGSEFPEAYYCKITYQLLVDPVTDREGNTYERNAIEQWLADHNTSPITRNPLSRSDLMPNNALKSSIQTLISQRRSAGQSELPQAIYPAAAPSPAPAQVYMPATAPTYAPQAQAVQSSLVAGMSAMQIEQQSGPIQFTLSSHSTGQDALVMLHSNQTDGNRAPLDVVCVVDISGSMGGEATLSTAAGTKESHGLSLLDIVKHAVKTIAHALTADDRLAIVVYATAARVHVTMRHMDQAGKTEVDRQLETLNPEDTTNIYDGLMKAIEELRANSESSGRMSAILLLTDGLPNVEPPRGTLPMLIRYKETNGFPCSVIGTFGFGYSLDSSLLDGIAREGNGLYAFIPDASFVGTAFVNSVSNLLTTVAKNVIVEVTPKPGVTLDMSQIGFKHTVEGGTYKIQFGTLHFGQSRTLVLKASNGGSMTEPVTARLVYELAGFRGQTAQIATVVSGPDRETEAKIHHFRLRFVKTVLDGVQLMKTAEVERAQRSITDLIREIKESPGNVVSHPWAKGILGDLEGQVSAAFSRKDWFQKWGVHYLPSLARAHELQQCNNFKDPGVQLYGGALFKRLRDEADDIFCRLPPPKPTIMPRSVAVSGASSAPARPAAPASMSVYNNQDNPCFDGNSMVLMADGSTKRVAQLQKGDVVRTGSGVTCDIACVVESACHGGRAGLVRLGAGLTVTPWHPVKAGNGEWRFPCEVGEVEELACEAVYSIVLAPDADAAAQGGQGSGVGGVVIGGVECATLGHGMRDEVRRVDGDGWAGESAVIWHDYFATARVIEDLRVLPGWDAGRVQFGSRSMARDQASGRLVDWRAESIVTGAVVA